MRQSANSIVSRARKTDREGLLPSAEHASRFRVVLGEVSICLSTSDEDLRECLGQVFTRATAGGNSDWLVRLIFFPAEDAPPRGDLRWVAHPRDRAVDVYVLGGRAQDRENLANVVLHGVFRHVCNVSGAQQFLMHGGLVGLQDAGLVFTGPSGIGKTTICRLLADAALGAQVFTDEKICISRTRGGFHVSNTPLGGDLRRKEIGRMPLAGMFFLRQSSEPSIRTLSSAEAREAVTGQLTPEFRIPGLRWETASEAGMAASASREVPCFEIGFRPDLSFWPLVEMAIGAGKKGEPVGVLR